MKEISYTKPIPNIDDPLRYEKTNFVSSEFIEVLTDHVFDVQMQYPVLGMKYAQKRCLIRKEVYDRLLLATERLPKGYQFRILDAWRPFALQEELYRNYSKEIIRDFQLMNCSEEMRNAVIRKFVSEPVADRIAPPVHTTGGAIDITIVDAEGNELDMGTGFDAFSDRTNTAFYENTTEEEIKNNRRLLYNVMVSAGFTNLPSEWWHYDYGDRFWAFYTGKPAMYEGVFTKEEMK